MAKAEPTIFISHAATDSEIANQLRRDISHLHWNVWDDAKINAGDNWSEQLEQALQKATVYLVVISPDSLKSEWANFEMGVAAARASASSDVTVIPVLHHGARWDDVPAPLRHRAGINANDMSASELSAVLRNRLETLSQYKAKNHGP